MGSGFRTFTAGEVLTASNVQNYLMDQSVMSFAGSAARSSAIGTANFEEGMVSYLQDTNLVEVYNGTNWASVAPVTDTPGLVHINTTSFSGVASQSFSSIFDKTLYNFWRVQFRLFGSVSTNTRLRGRANTTDISTNVYGASYYADYAGGAAVFSSSNNAAQATIAAHSNTDTSLLYVGCDVSLADANFHWIGNAFSGDGAKAHFFGFNIGGSGVNGFSIIPTSGTITGTCSIFAYKK